MCCWLFPAFCHPPALWVWAMMQPASAHLSLTSSVIIMPLLFLRSCSSGHWHVVSMCMRHWLDIIVSSIGH